MGSAAAKDHHECEEAASRLIQVDIYEQAGSEWRLQDVLQGHDLRVTGIDWAANTNRIVTCGADRNVYLWTCGSDGKWSPTLVLLRINRAATCVKWSSNGPELTTAAHRRKL